MSLPQENIGRRTFLDFCKSKLVSYTIEWLIWIVLAGILFSQTEIFSQPIAEYAFGASGWPRVICLAVILGATCQYIFQILEITRDKNKNSTANSEEITKESNFRKTAQRIGIFLLPLIYLYFLPSVGFYLLTPFFILMLLLLLEVRRAVAIVAVIAVVYGLTLLIFTRLFYVALPTGSIEFFYNLNNLIIGLSRVGL